MSPFAFRDYRLFWAAKLLSTVAQLLLVVVIGWQVYDVARRTIAPGEAAFVLGMVGLAQFAPLVLLTLVVGYVADRVDRRHVARAAVAVESGCAMALVLVARADDGRLWPLFVVAAVLGAARAFATPALSALAPNLVPAAVLPRAIAWNSIAWQSGAVAGPLLGGLLYAVAPPLPYAVALVAFALALGALLAIRPVERPARSDARALDQIRDGLRYVRRNPVVLGAISLDLFAVILGGVTALLPIYARDILFVGPEGLGWLRAAPAVGAAAMAAFFAVGSLGRGVGRKMFVAVGVFGLATAVFGLSRDLRLSCAMLAIAGAADMVSVYVRSTLIQIHTADAMRGRVAAVASLFIGASNELGEFRGGTVTAAIGPVATVAGGGLLSVAIAIGWARLFPALWRADTLGDTPSPVIVEAIEEARPTPG